METIILHGLLNLLLVLETKYRLNIQEIKDLIQTMVWGRLKKKVDAPFCAYRTKSYLVWDRLKIYKEINNGISNKKKQARFI